MIAVDTSALMAILLDEPDAAYCSEALFENERIVISAATVVEALIVARGRELGTEMAQLFEELDLEIVSVSPTVA